MGFNFGKVLGGVAAISGIVPGGQALAGVAGAIAKAVATEEGVRYLSPYLDATIEAPFGFPSRPAALTPKPAKSNAVESPLATAFATAFGKPDPYAKVKPLFRLKGAERAPYAPGKPKANLAGLLRSTSIALRAHPQFMSGVALKWVDETRWVERVARLRVGRRLDEMGQDPSWAFYDDPPDRAQSYLEKFQEPSYLTAADFQPGVAIGPFGSFAPPTPQNLQGIPVDKLAERVEFYLARARDMYAIEVERVWDEIRAQQTASANLNAIAQEYKAHTEAALANGFPMLSIEQFLAQTGANAQPAQVVDANETATLAKGGHSPARKVAIGVGVGLVLLWLA